MENKITTIVLHYRRPENVAKWIEGIRMQTVPSEIWVWDNSGDYPQGSGEDVCIKSSRNFNCHPRFVIAGMVQTPYIYNQDDDLAINDKFMFEKFIEHSEKYPEYAIGWNGRIFSKDINWDKAYQSPGKGWVDYQDENDDMSIDMINVGVSFFPTKLINQVMLNPFVDEPNISEQQYKYSDDIWVSYWLKKKRTMPFKLLDHYKWLNEYEERQAALSKQSEHMNMRNKTCRKLFMEKYK